jgi:hypothetical protein
MCCGFGPGRCPPKKLLWKILVLGMMGLFQICMVALINYCIAYCKAQNVAKYG